ncbi:TerC family integral membrane protein (plasmid) [Rhizobium gallicum]|uniref:TerC family integral membrane protein n=1 Tax=Rhizobium gallicum TaxID=56730 RepID=A0A1L5NSR6_9HYPH|nr:TerC family integral membrane protein [Rhizobium gallicum]
MQRRTRQYLDEGILGAQRFFGSARRRIPMRRRVQAALDGRKVNPHLRANPLVRAPLARASALLRCRTVFRQPVPIGGYLWISRFLLVEWLGTPRMYSRSILGLRTLYFALAAMIHRFRYLKPALAVVLIFIGSKIFVADLLALEKFPAAVSLGITFAIIVAGVVWSLLKTRDQQQLA